MAHNIQMIGIDLDGTLLRKDQSVSDGNKKALKQCLDKGIQVYLISGRPYCFAKYIASQIDSRVKVIASNGGIYEIGNLCIEHSIDQESLHQVIDILDETQMKAFFKGKHDFYTHEPYDKRFLYDHLNPEFEKAVQVQSYSELTWQDIKEIAHDIVKILVYHMDEAQLKKARDRIECTGCVEVTDYQRISFDITAKGVNKGNILKKVLAYHDIAKENFMAIGDGHNDIAMFLEAGIAVGMKNAQDNVKAYCDFISDDNVHDGVAKAIHHFIMK